MNGLTSETLVLLALGLPALGALGIAAASRIPNLREAVTLTAAGATFADMCEEVKDVIEPKPEGAPYPCNFRVVGLIGRLAALAAPRETNI